MRSLYHLVHSYEKNSSCKTNTKTHSALKGHIQENLMFIHRILLALVSFYFPSLFIGSDENNKQHYNDTLQSSVKKIKNSLQKLFKNEIDDIVMNKLVHIMLMANPIRKKDPTGTSHKELLFNCKLGRNIFDLHFLRNITTHRKLIIPHKIESPFFENGVVWV